MNEVLEVGTLVEHSANGRGVVIPNFMSMCGEGQVMVDFDHPAGTRVCFASELKYVGKIKVEFDCEKCKKCAFANSHNCLRYASTRFGWMMSGRPGRIIPKRIYPYCQQEA